MAKETVKSNEYPGVNPKWLRHRNDWFHGLKAWHDDQLRFLTTWLEHYVAHGFKSFGYSITSASTPYANWPTSDLFGYADQLAFEFVVKGICGESPRVDCERAAQAYAAHHLGALINCCFGENYRLDLTVFGIVIGCGESTLQVAHNMVRNAARLYDDVERTPPLRAGMFAILADYFGEPFEPKGRMRDDPTLVRLRARWRDPDPKAIAADCLTLCDDHTYTTAFHSIEWFNYMPIEILLLFRLRQRLGLENPHLDHPLMNTPLGQLPDPVEPKYDDLCTRVRARMIQEGFDETLVWGNDEWSLLRKESLKKMRPFLHANQSELDPAIATEQQALAIAEREGDARRLFHNLRALGVMYRAKDQKAEAIPYYERALALSEPELERGPDLILRDLVPTYHDLGRAAEAEALCRQYDYTWPKVVPANLDIPKRPRFIWPNELADIKKRMLKAKAKAKSGAPGKRLP